MGGNEIDGLDSGFVVRAVAELEETIGEVLLGRRSWQAVCECLRTILPGSVASFASYDFGTRAVLQAFDAGIEPEYITSYIEHYGSINGWIDFWGSQPPGIVCVSERDFPSAKLRGTDFYEAWILPQESMHAAVGVRFDVGGRETVHLSWNYPLALAPRYDPVAQAIVERIVVRVAAAVEVETRLRASTELGIRSGALIDRIGGISLILDRNRRIVEMNPAAHTALSRGDVLGSQGESLLIREAGCQRWLEETLRSYANGGLIAAHDRVFSIGRCTFRATITPLTGLDGARSPLLIPPRRMYLLTLRPLIGAAIALDHEALRAAFGLSIAEIRLCELLVNGHSLQEAASTLELAEGTIRQRIKSVFHKTQTHRQGELVGVLVRLSSPMLDGDP